MELDGLCKHSATARRPGMESKPGCRCGAPAKGMTRESLVGYGSRASDRVWGASHKRGAGAEPMGMDPGLIAS